MRANAQWYPEVKEHADGTPIILVGTKLDLREKESAVATLRESGQEPVSPAQGKAAAAQIGAVKYLECSALTQENLSEARKKNNNNNNKNSNNNKNAHTC